MNVKKHYDKKYKMVNPTGSPKKDIASTVHHEMLHLKHPQKSETKVRRMEKKFAKSMTSTQQRTLLAKLKRHG